MSELVRKLLLRALVCIAVAALGWWFVGPTGLLPAAVVAGLLFAEPLLDLFGHGVRGMRAAAWRDLEGRHYEFRGRRFYVYDDEEGHRWVRARDVRQVLGPGARDSALARTLGAGWRVIGRDGCFEAEALARHLERDTRDEAARLKHWVEREIAFPARRRRDGRVGVETLPQRGKPADGDASGTPPAA